MRNAHAFYFFLGAIFFLLPIGISGGGIQLAYAGGVPSIISYQGRLTDQNGNLLGGSSGSTYYFKFSLWDNSTVGNPTRLWPTVAPTSIPITVRTGVFTVNIGDVASGYPDALDYNFTSPNIYLQVEVSSNNSSFETLSPRQLVSASAFAKIAGAVTGLGQSFIGTTSPATANTNLTVQASTSASTPLTVIGAVGQSASLFQIQNSSLNNLFSVDSSGNISGSSALSIAGLSSLTRASSTLASALDGVYIGRSASTTIFGDNATSTFNGSVTITRGLNVNTYLFGAGLSSTCGGSGDKLLWSGGIFSCGTDAGGSGSGVTALRGQYSAAQTGATQIFATSSDTNILLTITSSGDVHTFAPSWTGTLAVNRGGTGASTFGQGWLYSPGGTGALAASTSPTIAWLTATSTTATSTFAGNINVNGNASTTFLTVSGNATSSFASGINVKIGCFAVNGSCVGTNAGTVTSFDASGGSTGLAFSGGPVTNSGTLTLSGILNVVNGGTGWAAIQAGTIPYGNGGSQLATTSAGSPGQILALLSGVPTWTATTTFNAPLTYTSGSVSLSTVGVNTGGTGATTFSQGWIYSPGGTTALAASTSPTVAWITATSTTATSSFYGNVNVNGNASTTFLTVSGNATSSFASGINVKTGCFAVNGSCIGTNAGTVTSVDGSGGSTGLTLTGGPITNTGTLTLGGILSVTNGGTGWAAIQAGTIPYGNGSSQLATTSAGSPGQILALLGGIPTWTSTTTFNSPLSYSSGSVSLSTVGVGTGGTGATTFGQGWVYSPGGTTALAASTSPTVAWITATSTTATSSFYGNVNVNGSASTTFLTVSGNATSSFASGINVKTGCFAVNGSCVGTNAGTVTSIDASGGSTGLTFSGGPVTNSGTLTLSGILNVVNGGTGWGNIVSGSVLYGNGTNQLSTTSSGTAGNVLALLGGVPTWTATTTFNSPLTYSSGSVSLSTVGVGTGGTGATTFSQGWIYSPGGTTALAASTSPTVAWITATSTTQASTFPYASTTFISSTNGAAFATSGGNVGVGTTTPYGRLSVQGSVDQPQLALKSNSSQTTNIFEVKNSTGATILASIDSVGLLFSNNVVVGSQGVYVGNSNVNLTQQSTNRLNIAATGGVTVPTGNVGIGTTSPNWLLQVAGIVPSIALTETSAATNLKHWLITNSGGNLYFGTSTDKYATSSPAALTITNSGNFGIGTSSPGTLFAIDGAANFTNGTSTFASTGGINLLNGCFSVNGVCTGKVSSVDGSGGSTGLTLTGGPITNTGTLTLGGILSVTNGGTGWGNIVAGSVLYGNGTNQLSTTSAGTAGNVLALLGGVPTWTATTTFNSPLSYSGGSVSLNTVGVGTGGTGATTFSQGWIYSPGGTTALAASTSPTVAWLTATSTTATSSFYGNVNVNGNASTTFLTVSGNATSSFASGVNLKTGCFAINGFCIGIGSGSGTVTSVDVDGASTGLSFTGGPVTGAGVITLSGILNVTNGGTGWGNIVAGSVLYGNGTNQLSTTSAGTAGNVLALLGGVPTWTATTTFNSPLTYAGGSVSLSTVGVNTGGTGATTFGQGWIYSVGGSTALNSSTSPTVAWLTATSTTATSTFAGNVTIGGNASTTFLTVSGNATSSFASGINVKTGCFSVNGNCVGTNAGTVTSVDASGGSTGLSFSGGPISSAGSLTLSGILNVANGGTGWAAIQAGTIPYGNGGSQLATTSAGSPGQILALLSGVPTWTATTTFNSPLSYSSGSVSLNTVGVGTGGTGATTFSQGWIYSPGGTTALAASTSPTVAWITATSTSQASTFPYASTTGFSSASNTYLASLDGYVGIGTSTPFAKLAVNPVGGDINQFVVGSSTATSFIIRPGGNVGVATTTPWGQLSVSNGTSSQPALAVRGSASQSVNLVEFRDSSNNQLSGVTNIGDFITYNNNPESTATSLGTFVGQGMRRRLTTIGFNFACGESITSATEPCFDLFPISSTLMAGGIAFRVGTSSNQIGEFQVMGNGQVLIGAAATTSLAKLEVRGTSYLSSNVGIGTTTPQWLLQVAGTRPSIALSDTSATTNQKHWLLSSIGGNFYLGTSTDAYGTSTPSALTINNSGNVGIGTSSPGSLFSLDGAANFTTGTSTFASTGGINLLNGCFSVNGVCTGKVSSVDASGGTTGLSFSGGPVTTTGTLTLAGTLNVTNGGTGWGNIVSGSVLYGNGTNQLSTTSAGTAGNVLALLGGIPTWTSTTTFNSPLTYSSGSVSLSTVGVGTGGTGATTFGQGWIYSPGGTTALAASTSPTVAWITATSTTATSSFYGNVNVNGNASTTFLTVSGNATSSFASGINLKTGCFAVNGNCVAGTVTSVDGSGASTGLTLTGGPITNTGTLTLGGILNVTNGGTGWGNIVAGSVLYGNGTNQLSTTSTGTAGNVLALLGGIPTWTSTTTFNSPLSYSAGAVSLSTVGVNTGGTGATTFSQGWIYSPGGTTALAASTSPTVAWITATSTTATSSFYGNVNVNGNASTTFLTVSGNATSSFASGVNLKTGCFAINGFCIGIGSGSGTVTSVDVDGASTGLSFTGGPITSAGSLTLSGILNVTNGGTGWGNIVSGSVLYGNGTSQLSTTSAGTAGNVLALLGGIPTWTATTTFNAPLTYTNGAVSLSTVGVGTGGTGATTFSQGWIYSPGGTTALAASTSPTVAWITATSTSRASTFPYASTTFTSSTNGAAFATLGGNVAIGSSTAVSKLYVYDTVAPVTFETKGTFTNSSANVLTLEAMSSNTVVDGGGPAITFNLATNSGDYNQNGQIGMFRDGGISSGAFYIRPALNSNLTTRAVFLSNGNVGFGTTSPNWNFQVAGTAPSIALTETSAATNLKHWLITNSGGNLYFGTSTDRYATSTPTAITITNSGNFGIGTSSPGSLLSIGQTANFTTGTSTFASTGGINLLNGCFSVNGVCTGKVSSVDASGGTTGLSFTGGPITNTGTLTLSGTLNVANGGTGWAAIQAGTIPYGNGSSQLATTSAGSPGQILALLGGVPTWTATTTFNSPLTYANGAVSLGTVTVTNGGTGAATFGQGWIYSPGGTTALSASTSPTVAWITATSTTATSSFYGNVNVNGNASTTFLTVSGNATSSFASGINLKAGCFAVNGNCVAGTVTSVDGSGASTGLTLTGGPITNTGTLTLGGILNVTNGGTGWGNIVAGTVLYGNGTSQLSTTSAGTAGNVLALLGGVPTWTATTTFNSPLSYSSGSVSLNTVGVGTGGTGATTFSQGWIYSPGGTGILTSSTSPTVAWITATSTTATSSFYGNVNINGNASTTFLTVSGNATSSFASGINVKTGCFAVNGNCVAGTVTSVDGSGASTGLTLTGGPITNTGTLTLGGILNVTNGGTGWGNIVSGSVLYGNGTNQLSTTSAGTAGNVLALLGGVPTWTATTTFNSPLSYSSGVVSLSTVGVGTGGTGQTTFSQGWIYSPGGTTALAASTSPTVAWLTATSTTATSSFYGNVNVNGNASTTFLTVSGAATSSFAMGINLSGGCFSMNGGCIGVGAGSGTVTSVATNNGLTGGPITNSGTIGLDVTRLQTNALLTWTGSVLAATGTPALTSGYFIATSSTATSTFMGTVGIGTSTPQWLLQVAGTRPSIALSDTSAAANQKHWLLSSIGGNLYIGSSSDAFATSAPSALTIFNNGNVGISTSSPGSLFSIGGVANFTNGTSTFASTAGINIAGGCFAINGTCVGGGSAVGGSGTVNSGLQGQFAFYNTAGTAVSGTSTLFVAQNTNIGIGTTSPFAQLSIHALKGSPDTTLFAIASSTQTATTTLLTFSNIGFLGIGTSSPYAVLSVVGSSGIVADNINATNTAATSTLAGGVTIGGGLLNYDAYTGITSASALQIGGAFSFDTNAGVVSWTDLPIDSSITVNTIESYAAQLNGSPVLTVFGKANGLGNIIGTSTGVGIGTTSPFAKLSVAGNGTGTGWAFAVSDIASSTKFVILDNGNVGVGTTSPAGLLSVAGSAYLGSDINSTLTIHSGIVNYPIISTTTIPNATTSWSIGTTTNNSNSKIITISGNLSTSTIGFFVSTTTGLTNGVGPSVTMKNMIFVGNGKINAGMAIVNGGLCVDSDGWCTASTTGQITGKTVATGGSDLAELYYSSDALHAGDVVAISSPASSVVLADKVRDGEKVLGVVSTEPGLILGSGPDADTHGTYPIALVGRVPIMISDENGPIEAGDYLTLSSAPGVAMKATRAGTVVGQALEAYASRGEGKILAFVKNTYFGGALPNLPGLAFNSRDNEMQALQSIMKVGSNSSTSPSIIVADQVFATQGILSPNLVTGSLASASTTDLGGLTNVTGNLAVSADTKFSGRVVIANLSVDSLELPMLTGALARITDLEATTSSLTASVTDALRSVSRLASTTADLASTTADLASTTALLAKRLTTIEGLLSVLSNSTSSSSASLNLSALSVNGITQLNGTTTVNGALSANSISANGETLNVLSETQFIGRPYFTRDTGGTALIKKGATTVLITFDRDYIETPVVSATIALDEASSSDADAQAFFDGDVRFLVTKKSVHGFTIRLNKSAPANMSFSWIALAVKNASLFTSVDVAEQSSAEVAPLPKVDQPPILTDPATTTVTSSGNSEASSSSASSSGITSPDANSSSSPAQNPESVPAPVPSPAEVLAPTTNEPPSVPTSVSSDATTSP